MKILGLLANKEKVIDRKNSHYSVDLSLLNKCLEKIKADNREYIEEEITFPIIVGKCNVVQTDDNDEIVYIQRPGRKGESRFVLNKEAIDSNIVTVVLKRALEKDTYLLITAYIGPKAPPELFDKNANSQSYEFWVKHAFVMTEKY